MHRTTTSLDTICTFTGVSMNGSKVLPDVGESLKGFPGKNVSVQLLLPSFLHFQEFMFSCPLGGSTGSCGPGQCSPPWRSSWQVWRCMILTEMPTEVSALASFTKRGVGQSSLETKPLIKLEHHNRERTSTPKPTTAILPPPPAG